MREKYRKGSPDRETTDITKLPLWVIREKAWEEGLSYGQYVAKYGL